MKKSDIMAPQKFRVSQVTLSETSDPSRHLIDRVKFPNGEYSAIIVLPGEALPTAGPIYRNIMAIVMGAPGVSDVIYNCIKDAMNVYSWVPIGSGGGGTYTNLTPLDVAHGGAGVGDTFVAQTMQQMFDKILYPYQAPAFSTFALDTGVVIEVGTTIIGAHNFTYTRTNPANILPPPAPNGIYVRDMTAGVDFEVAQPDASPIAHVFAGTVYHVDAINTYRIQGTNSHSANFNSTFTVHWHWLYYSGPNAGAGPLTEAQIKALVTSALSDTFARTYSFAAGATYKYICYPAVWGTATRFKDSVTGLDVPFEAVYTVNVTNINGDTTAYNVHRSTNIIGAAIDIIVS